MKHEIKVWLEDIRKSIDEIHMFLPKTMNYDDFVGDLKT